MKLGTCSADPADPNSARPSETSRPTVAHLHPPRSSRTAAQLASLTISHDCSRHVRGWWWWGRPELVIPTWGARLVMVHHRRCSTHTDSLELGAIQHTFEQHQISPSLRCTARCKLPYRHGSHPSCRTTGLLKHQPSWPQFASSVCSLSSSAAS